MLILFDEPSPIPLHAFIAMVAVLLGAVQLCMKKGTRAHKLIGWVWVGSMLIVSISSFFIHELKLWGDYSPIHLLSVLTLFFIGLAVYFARVRNIERHKRAMIALYFLALILTGLFTLMPGRVMHQVLFGA